MKQFIIRYRFQEGSADAWHAHMKEFIAALDADPVLGGRIAYRCMRIGDGPDYCHIATAADDEVVSVLQTRDFFKRYTEETKRVAGGKVDVTRVEIIAETKPR